MFSRFLFIFCLINLIFFPLLAQQNIRLKTHEIERKGNYFSRQRANFQSEKQYQVEPGFAFTGLIIRTNADEQFHKTFLVVNGDSISVVPDEHRPDQIEELQSSLIFLNEPISEFQFFPGSINGEVSFHFYNGGTVKIRSEKKNLRQKVDEISCIEPESVSQQEWRTGLPAPNYTRSFTLVSHLIVHHAATSNQITDYTGLVRDIYLWHTESNGWSDIGYNYLIAPDGTIFKGRDPGNGEQDNVRGAHFCGQNSGTMGVCLLGNYVSTEPADAMIASLEKLLSWKADKEGLDPLSYSSHPANSYLGAIAGHRDGCATECPGDRVYARLDEFREQTALLLASPNCSVDTLVVEHEFNLFPVPAEKELNVQMPDTTTIDLFQVYSLQGQLMQLKPEIDLNKAKIDVSKLPSGMYIIRVTSNGIITERKIIVQ